MRPIVIAALMVASAGAAHLRVVVYDQARLTKEVTQTAFEDLRQVFHQAGIDANLVAGDAAASEAALITYPAPPPKGHEQEAACLARRDIALEILAVAPALAQLKSTILGVAQPLARAGLNARVFDDRIQDAAMRENRTHAAVLAHVIAHEIGHVLLRTNAHSRRGLMSAQWTDYEYGTIARSLMFFTTDQSKTMRMALSGAGCGKDAVVSTEALAAEAVNPASVKAMERLNLGIAADTGRFLREARPRAGSAGEKALAISVLPQAGEIEPSHARSQWMEYP